MISFGAGKRFFIAKPNITDILGNTDLIERILLLYSVLNPRFPNSWVARCLDLGTGILAMAGCGLGERGGSCWMLMVSGWHCWTTEVRRPKEVRQCCENPSSASPVWGMQHKSEKFSEQQTRTRNNSPPQASVKAA